MQGQPFKRPSAPDMEETLGKHRQAIAKLAQSGDAQKLVSMLKQAGGVQQAAQAAAQGDASHLMGMMNQLSAGGAPAPSGRGVRSVLMKSAGEGDRIWASWRKN